MLRRACVFSLFFVLVFGANLCAAQIKHRRQKPIRLNTLLGLELLAMEEADQRERQKSIVLMSEPKEGGFAIVEAINQLDLKHTKRLQEIIREFGWPSAALVGQRGVAAAFLIVQHSPSLKFQKQCLPFIRAAARDGDLQMRDVAMLTNRILTNEGKPQIYGTQFKNEGGTLVPFPIANRAKVDKRRATVGLPPLAEYIKMLEAEYRMPAKDKAP
ncbi:MAG TPA: DUF6624 domain-containing protein [Pyrinomonadaceae bacterium]|jgi:hypothetical protein